MNTVKFIFLLLLITSSVIANPNNPISPNSTNTAPSNSTNNLNLLSMLTNQLGVNEQQAANGIGALMNLAKQHLATNDYTRLLTNSPDLATLTNSATPPQPTSPSSGLGAILGYATSILGSQGGLTDLVQLTQSFLQLGLSADMVGKFFKIALNYVQGTGGLELMNLLAGALKF